MGRCARRKGGGRRHAQGHHGGARIDDRAEKSVVKTKYHSESFEEDMNYHFFESEKPLDRFVLLPNEEAPLYALNGVVLESNNPGIIYHNIGVNGAKYSDYNKYPAH